MLSATQIVALIIFVLMFVLIVMDKIERQWVTLGCGAGTLLIVFGLMMKSPATILESLNVASIFHRDFWITSEAESASIGVNWSTIIFIAGMMIMVEGMAEAGFFQQR